MFSVSNDIIKNRLHVELKTTEKGDGEKLYQEIKTKIPELKAVFTGISDITQYSVAHQEETLYIDKIFKLLSEHGMTRAIRVTGFNAKEDEFEDTNYNFIISLAKTIKDADRILDNL